LPIRKTALARAVITGRGRRPGRLIPRGLALGAPLLLVLLVGCAYYNTFYYAKKYYAKARKIEETSKTERLAPEAIKFYDQAIEKAAKVIVDFGGGWRAGVDDALLLMGACYYGKRDYETALGKFNELLVNYPHSDHAPEALFYTGLCYHQRRNFGAAERVFAELLRAHPDFPRRDEIRLITAEGLQDEGDEAGALRQYARLLEEFRKSRYRENALLQVGTIHFDDGRFDSALVAYQELARTTRDDQAYVDAQLKVGACLVRLGRYDDALSIYARILPSDPERNELSARIWLAVADAQNRAGQHAKALETLQLVVTNFESRNEGTEAQFQIGYTNEVYQRDYAAARTAYEAAAASRTRSVFKDQATRRLENLGYLIELAAADSSGADSVAVGLDQRAQAALRVAEFAYFDGNDPRTALTEYASIAHDFPQTDVALRAVFAQAWILTQHPELDTLQTARGLLREIAGQHADAPQARGAVNLLTELGEPDSLLAPLRAAVGRAEREAARRDSAATADSLADARARADSLMAMRAAADALAAASAAADSIAALAAADSIAAAGGVPDSLAASRRPVSVRAEPGDGARLRHGRPGASQARPDSIAMGPAAPDSITPAGGVPGPPPARRRPVSVRAEPVDGAHLRNARPGASQAGPDSSAMGPAAPDSSVAKPVVPDSSTMGPAAPDSIAAKPAVPDSIAPAPAPPMPDAEAPKEEPKQE
jgi:TolA-binding protein